MSSSVPSFDSCGGRPGPKRVHLGPFLVSTEQQDVDAQRVAINSWAEREGVGVRYYEENGVSGASQRRPVLDELVADVEAGRVSTVIVAALAGSTA